MINTRAPDGANNNNDFLPVPPRIVDSLSSSDMVQVKMFSMIKMMITAILISMVITTIMIIRIRIIAIIMLCVRGDSVAL